MFSNKSKTSIIDKNKSDFLTMAITALRLNSEKLLTTKSSTSDENILAEISLKEVSQHDTPDDCWIVIYDRVYDITNFLDTHPGGSDLLLEHAGRDGSFAFRGAGHSRVALLSLKQFQIGQLPKEERIFRCEGLLRCSDLPE